jgi:HK97 family phage major capsid protein
MAIDVNRNTTGVLNLPSTLSQTIWQETEAQSVVQTLSPKMELPGGGVDIPIITGDPEAEWVAETEEKKVDRPSFANKNLKGYTLAVIVPFSNQFRRDLPSLYAAVEQKLPQALAKKFDRTALGFAASPGTGFDTLADAPEVALTGKYADYLAALSAVGAASDDADITAWALSKQAEVDALGIADNAGRPLLVNDLQREGSIGSILARPVHKSNFAADSTSGVIGVAGDWASTAWGFVEGIQISVSDQATLNDGGTALNLWQRNMFAVRAEVEVGFAVRDPKRFVRLTKGNGGAEGND